MHLHRIDQRVGLGDLEGLVRTDLREGPVELLRHFDHSPSYVGSDGNVVTGLEVLTLVYKVSVCLTCGSYIEFAYLGL
jgi:hypothetical protein